MSVVTRIDSERGCGWRKPGGTYLIGGKETVACGLLPVPLECCPTCSQPFLTDGKKRSRSWTWVDGDKILALKSCPFAPCGSCLLGKPVGKVGLLWVGEKFYNTPGDFMAEVALQGVSRRIPTIPKDFKLGETIVLFAHGNAIRNDNGTYTAGVFTAFKPTSIEYVIKGDETDEEIADKEKRGITCVRVIKDKGGLPGILEGTTP